MKRKQFPFPCALALVAGCATQALDDPDPPPGETTTAPAEGSHGTMKVRRGDGSIHDVTYTVHQGHAFWQDDIDLGPAPVRGVRALAIVGLDHRWPGGYIDFDFDTDVTETMKSNIRAATAEIQRLTPLVFHEGLESGHPYIRFKVSTRDDVSFTTGIGPDGTGAGDETNVNIFPTHPSWVIQHEIGHAIGLDHEQERQDRDQFVDFDPSCSTDDSQFSIDGSSYTTMTAYDLTSIMHYSSGSFCEPADAGSFGVGGTGCKCFPIVVKGTSHTTMTGFIPKNTRLSPADVRAITRMYEPMLGINASGDKYGAASVTGDFNHDGFADLAIGVPGKNGSRGAVDLYMGTEAGLVAWKTLDASGVTLPGAGDQFGYSLAAGDINSDGIDDLIVGAPGRNTTAIAAGAVFVYPGADEGPDWLNGSIMTQGAFQATDAFGDAYGTAIQVADLDHDGRNELIVSAPSKATGGVRSGVVYIYFQNGPSFYLWKTATEPGTTAAGDSFGKSLAVGDFDDDGKPDLAIGAPATSKPGSVFVFRDAATSLSYVITLTEASTGADAPATGDKFGASLAIGHFDRAKHPSDHLMDELAIGAPGKDNPTDSGRVYVFKPIYDAIWGTWLGVAQATYFGQHSVPNTDNLAGDSFGTVLAVTDFDHDGYDDLAVGVPNKDMSSKADAGAAEIFRGSTTSLHGAVMYGQTPLFSTTAGDHFGSSLAIGDFNHDLVAELVVGAPNHLSSVAAGAFDLFPGMSGALPLSFAGYWDQTTFSPE